MAASPTGQVVDFDINMLSPANLGNYSDTGNGAVFLQSVYACYTKGVTSNYAIPHDDPCNTIVPQFCANTGVSNPFNADIAGSDFCSCIANANPTDENCNLVSSIQCMTAKDKEGAYINQDLINQQTDPQCVGNKCMNTIIINGSNNTLSNVLQVCNGNYTEIFTYLTMYRNQMLLAFLSLLVIIITTRIILALYITTAVVATSAVVVAVEHGAKSS